MSLDGFLSPSSVVVVGGSPIEGKFGYQIVKNITSLGFRGRLYVVNLKGEDVLGVPAAPRVDMLEEVPELGVVVLPPDAAVDAFLELADANVRNVIMASSGFSEAGGEGVERERVVLEEARRKRIRVFGPSTVGLVNFSARFAPMLTPVRKFEAGEVSFVGHSGGLTCGLGWWQPEDVKFSKLIHVGNACDVNEEDVLKFLSMDRETKVILCQFCKLTGRVVRGVEEAASVKPVVAYCVSDEAEKLRDAGAICVSHYNEMFDAARILLSRVPRGNRVAVIGPSSGAISIATSRLEENGLTLACLSEKTERVIREKVLSPFSPSVNPVDYWPPTKLNGEEVGEKHRVAVNALVGDERVDIVFLILELMEEIAFDVEKAFREAADKDKTLVAVLVQVEDNISKEVRKGMRKLNIPYFWDAERAVRVVGEVAKWAQRRYQSIQTGVMTSDATTTFN
ncbi:MAG: CoA-binding protein [Candidatus Jordarchaeales archaeon]